jgi:hypothetical protein
MKNTSSVTIGCISLGLWVIVLLYAIITRSAMIIRLMPVIMIVVLGLGAAGMYVSARNMDVLNERNNENESE